MISMVKYALFIIIFTSHSLFAQEHIDIIEEAHKAEEKLDFFSYIGSWEKDDWLLFLHPEDGLGMSAKEKEHNSGL